MDGVGLPAERLTLELQQAGITASTSNLPSFAGSSLNIASGTATSIAVSGGPTQTINVPNIPITVNSYGNGTHTWPYWQRELHRSWPQLMTALGLPG